MPKFKNRLVVLSDGERYSLLVDESGSPHWFATLYATTQVRNASKAPNTIQAVLGGINLLFSWADENDIDLESRFSQRRFLTASEVESLRAYTQTKKSAGDVPQNKPTRKRVFGANLSVPPSRVSSATHYNRLTYIADFLSWYASRIVEREAKAIDAFASVAIKAMEKSILVRRPQKSHRSRLSQRKGLSQNGQNELLELVRAGSQNNPFSVPVQVRNEILILILYHLGVRAGELLSLKVSDFDFQNNEVVIARRHGDIDDPRKNQPVAKTLDRRVPLTQSLAKLIYEYVVQDRNQFPRAQKHEFLLVVHRSGPYHGAPLTSKGLAKIFTELRNAGSSELANLTPHVLRHTANENFSVLMDKKGVSSAEEEKMRSYLMGWKEGSGSAATYTRRHIESKAREVSLQLQDHKKGSNH